MSRISNESKHTLMQAFSLHEGYYSVGTDKKFIPFDPKTDDKKDRKGSLFIHVQPFLVQHNNDLIVIDTGLGQYRNGELLIHSNIQKEGFDPSDVNLVLMSHLHQDHSSGMVFEKDGKLEVTFPNAEYIIQRQEWEEAYSGNSSSYRTEIFDVLQRSGQIQFVEGSGQLNDYISYELSGGHTKAHQVFHIEGDDQAIFYGGDEWPEPEQALRQFMAKYDYDGRKAMELREQYANDAAKNNWRCLFYHANNASIATITKQDESFKIIPA